MDHAVVSCVAIAIAIAVAIPSGCGESEDGGDSTAQEDGDDGGSGSDEGDGPGGGEGPGGSGGGGGGAPPIGASACELGIAVTGAVTWSTPSTPACAIPFGPSIGVTMGYVFLDGQMQAVQLDVEEVTEGEVGTFPAAITLTHEDGRTWTTMTCTVAIQSHVPESELDDEFSRAYRVQATGTCVEPATNDAGSESLVVAPFALRFPARWS